MSARPLRWILSLQAILVTIVPFAVVAGLIALLLLPQIRKDIESRQHELAGTIEAQVTMYLASALADVKAISLLPLDKPGLAREIQQLLDAQIVASRSLNLIYIADRQGRVSTVAIGFDHSEQMHRNLQGVNLTGNKLFQEVLRQNKPVWSDTFLSIVGSSMAVAVAVPTAKSVIFGEIDLGRLTSFIRHTADREGQIIFVLDSRGQVIADQQGSYTAQQINLSNIPFIMNGIASKDPLHGEFQFNGRTMNGSMISIPAYNWSILVAQPSSSVLKPYRTITFIVAAGLGCALLLGICAALVMARRLSLRFTDLAEHARKVAKGDESTAWPGGNITEFKQLGDTLQQMAETLRLREKTLLETSQQLQLYFERLPIASIVWGTDYRVMRWNPAAEKVFGYSAAMAVGKTANELVVPADIKADIDRVWQLLLEGNQDANSVNNNITRDGRIITCFWTNTPHRNLQGETVGVISVIEDITVRMTMEAELHKLSRAVEQSPVSIVITDGAGTIEYVNPKFSQLTGYTAAEALGNNPRILKSGHTPTDEYQHLWKSITTGNIWHGELCNKKKNGELYWEAATIAPIFNKAGEITNFVGVKEDISDKKRVKEELHLNALRFQNLYELSIMSDVPEDLILDFALEAALQVTASSIGYIYSMNDDETLLTLHAWSRSVMSACTIPVTRAVHTVAETGEWGDAVRQRKPVIINGYETPDPFNNGYPEGYVPVKRHMTIPILDNGRIIFIAGVGNKEADYRPEDVHHLNFFMAAVWRIIHEKRADQLLKKSEDNYRLLFENMTTGFALHEMIYDQEGRAVDYRYLQINPAFEKLTGVPVAVLIGKTVKEIMPQTENYWIETFGRVAQSGEPIAYQNYARELQKYFDTWVFSPCRGQFAVIFHDITDRRIAEEALKESEERLREMFVQNNDAIILVRMKKMLVTDANPAALRLYGISREELPRLSLRRLIGRDGFHNIIRAIRSNEIREGFMLEKITGYRITGEKILVSIKGKIILLKNEDVILCTIRDITEKLRLEEEIKVSQAKLIQANKMGSLGMLVSGVAHEINNPNNCIAVNSSVLMNIWHDVALLIRKHCEQTGMATLGKLSWEETLDLVPQLFTGITESSQRINSIVVNMRDFVKSGQNKQAKSFDINKIIANATAILWHHIHRYTDNFTQELAEHLPQALGNAQQIEQVIINLLMNAMQALPDKSHGVCLVTACDAIAGNIVVTIRDEGKGMDRETLQRLAEPFFTTREAEGGTGLGLYISTTIIKDYHGTLDFDSAPGKGTTATIRLVMAEKDNDIYSRGVPERVESAWMASGDDN